MTTQEQIRKVTDIAQEKGWSINVEDENKTSIQFEFQRYTKYGQDFNFNADMQDEDIDTLHLCSSCLPSTDDFLRILHKKVDSNAICDRCEES